MKRALLVSMLVMVACGEKEEPPKEPKKKTEHGLETFGTSGTTKQMFKDEGLKALQEKLASEMEDVRKKLDEGLPDAGGSAPKNEPPEELEATGNLDAKTQEALGSYQKVHGLPETGLPDFQTLRSLGFKPADVFHHRPPATQGRKE